MDPRQARTRAALSDAIHELATSKPVDDVTMSEIARIAGVTRDTVHRHTQSPAHLLTTVLGEELDEIVAANSELPVRLASGTSVFEQPTVVLLEHIVEHEAIYRNALLPRLNSLLRHLLADHITTGLLVHLRAHPEIAPDVLGQRPDESAMTMLAAYAGSGTVSVIERWLAEEPRASIEYATAAILAAAPEWWQGVTQ